MSERSFSSRNASTRIGKDYRVYFGTFVIVPENYALMVHRFKKFHARLNFGLQFKLPIIDTIEYVHDLREQAIQVHSQVAVTRDNVALHIDGVLYIQVVDPEKASYNVESYRDAIINLAQTTMRSEIGKLSLDSLFEERETLNEKIVQAIEKESAHWGIHSIRYEIKDIEPPTAIQKSMVLQAEAERRKRASILTSEGEKMANINIADAEKQAQVLEAKGKAEAIIVKAKAQAEALEQIEAALSRVGGKEAAQFILGQRYITAYKSLARSNNTIIMPSQPHDIQTQISEALNVLEKKKPAAQ